MTYGLTLNIDRLEVLMGGVAVGTTLEAPTHTVADRIPLGRRIEELKKEKGGWYSTAAMSKRIGLSDETFRQMLKLKRVIYTFELDKIAKDLKMPVERILQSDIGEEVDSLSTSLKSLKNPSETLQLALTLEGQTNGLSERCYAMHRLGVAYLMSYKFREARQVLANAKELAEQMQSLYGDTDALFGVLNHLMVAYTALNEYESASKMLSEINPIFVAKPSRQSALSYQKAKVEETRGNFYLAKQYAMESLFHARESENPIQVARARLNMSHFHYLLKEYEQSQDLLLLAIDGLDNDNRTKLVARKELVKTLLKMGNTDLALHHIELGLLEAKDEQWRDMVGKLTILLTVATNQQSHAQSVLADTDNSLRIQYLACKCLQDHYKALNDSENFLLYTKIAEGMCISFSDFLDEGEL
jgi:tetratricopeptide (TPR) repeat protein